MNQSLEFDKNSFLDGQSTNFIEESKEEPSLLD